MNSIRIGVVENNVDPLKLGRIQVRIFGLHTEDRTIYPVEDLPWAIFLLNSSSISGEGNFFIPNNGDFVAISFIDPEEQNPVILGVISKFVESLPNFNIGFSDPNSINPDSNYVNESGLSRLARNENISDTIIQDKKDNRTIGVQCNSVSWNEPETQYNTEYPKNKVIHTKNHIIELDDTDGKERVHIYHKTGTSKEIHPNGDEVDLIKAKRYIVVDSDNNLLVKGNYNSRIETNVNREIVGAENKKMNESTEDISNTKTISASDVETNASNTQSMTAGSTIEIDAGGNITITSGGSVSITGTTISLN